MMAQQHVMNTGCAPPTCVGDWALIDSAHPIALTFLKGLQPHDVDEVTRALRLMQYPRGSYIFHAGEPTYSLFFVVEGVVKKTYTNARGDEQILGFFQVGELFGHLFLGRYRHRIGTAVAVTHAVAAMMLQDDLEALIGRIPRFGINFVHYFANEQRETLAKIHAIRQASALYRLLGTLLTLARRAAHDRDGWYTLPIGITQLDIASLAGLNRTTASLLINSLRRDDILGGGGRILTVHRARVEHLLTEAGLEILE
jgi:CRP-like cAMP-binding protein